MPGTNPKDWELLAQSSDNEAGNELTTEASPGSVKRQEAQNDSQTLMFEAQLKRHGVWKP